MDNERPIEKLLRDYAKKRRADAGGTREMHPATRRMLQGEVARQFPKSPRAGFPLAVIFARWKPGLTYALCALALVAVSLPLVLTTYRKSSTEAELARAVSNEAASDKKLSIARSAPAAAQEMDESRGSSKTGQAALALADPERAQDNVSPTMKREEPAAPPAHFLASDTSIRSGPGSIPPAPQIASRSQPQPATAPMVQSRAVTRETSRSATDLPRKLAGEATVPTRDAHTAVSPESVGSPAGAPLAARSPDPVPISSARPSAASTPTESAVFSQRYGLAMSEAATVVQKFSQTLATNNLRRAPESAPTAVPILTTFQLEQTGDQLRVIDSDGSTYVGVLSAAAVDASNAGRFETKGQTARTTSAVPSARSDSEPARLDYQTAQNLYFRVTGTNRTWQQPVVFSGNIRLLTNAPVGGQTAVQQKTAARTPGQFAPTQDQLPNLRNSSITGKVQLGTNQELPINAVPVPP